MAKYNLIDKDIYFAMFLIYFLNFRERFYTYFVENQN